MRSKRSRPAWPDLPENPATNELILAMPPIGPCLRHCEHGHRPVTTNCVFVGEVMKARVAAGLIALLASPVLAQETSNKIDDMGALGCRNLATMKQLSLIHKQWDQAAHHALLERAIVGGVCRMIGPGVSVFIMSTEGGSWVQVREQGKLDAYWTLRKFLKK